jgi:hypothetical protein
MSGYQVDPAELRSHAIRLGQLAGTIEHAADAAKQEGIGGVHPYGLLFSPLVVPVLGTVAAAAKTMISGTGTLGHAMQQSLAKNVDVYELAEEQTARGLKKIIQ